MPNSIFSWQIILNKAKFLEFGSKNSNLATLSAYRGSVANDSVVRENKRLFLQQEGLRTELSSECD